MADTMMMDDTQAIDFQLDGFDSADDPPKLARVDGPPVASTSDESYMTATSAADGMSGSFLTVDLADDAEPKVVTATIKADANLDPNVQDFITWTQDFLVSPKKPPEPVAATMRVTLGAPRQK